MSSDEFLKLGNRYTDSKRSRSQKVKLRRFKSFFGVTPTVCSLVWLRIKSNAPGSHPKHLLWGLLFLKQYSIEHIRRSIVNADEKTIRKWSWIFVKLISDMNVVYLVDKEFHSAILPISDLFPDNLGKKVRRFRSEPNLLLLLRWSRL